MDENDVVTPESGGGPVTWPPDPPIIKPDVTAPSRHDIRVCQAGGGYLIVNGKTSTSAPHVAGAAALIKQAAPSLSVSDIRTILEKGAVDLGTAGKDNDYGSGRIDVYQSVLLAYAYSSKSASATATASNNGRRLVRTSDNRYHLVFESGSVSGGNLLSEIFYRRSNVGGSSWEAPVRLSAGDEQNRFPSIAERSGSLYVTWQRWTGSSYAIHFRKSTNGGSTWGGITSPATVTGTTNYPLPVIVSPTTNTLSLAFRSVSNIKLIVSTNDGSSWQTNSVGTQNDNSPSLAATTTGGSNYRTALAFARASGSGTIYYRYYRNGSDSTVGWGPGQKNLSSIVPGSYTGHQKPSIAPSGTTSNTTLHLAWEATYNGTNRVIIHRLATNWYTWSPVWSTTWYNDQQQPSITGLANATADLLWRSVSQNSIYRSHYNGSTWDGPQLVVYGDYPSVSVGYTNAKYAWMEGTSSPYQVKASSETLSKTEGDLDLRYHRSVAVIDTTSGAWFELRLDNLAVKTKSNDTFTFPLLAAREDTATLTPRNIFTNLASALVTLPEDADSLLVDCALSWGGLAALRADANPVIARFALASNSGASIDLPAVTANTDAGPVRKLRLAANISALAGKQASLGTRVTGVGRKPFLIASLGHVYEYVDQPVPKSLDAANQSLVPREFALQVHPNPFNPSTQIQFSMPEEGLATVRIFSLGGQLIRELISETRKAGSHVVTWDGRNDQGMFATSGVYFIHFEAGPETLVKKVTLLK